jgi:hypothetical protein
MAKPKKPSPVFEVLFDGKGVYPEAIPLGTLTQTLSAIRRLAAGADTSPEEDDEDNDAQDNCSIRLVGVKRGSAVFQFVGKSADSDLANLRGAGKVLTTPEDLGDNDYVLRPIEILSATAKRLNCTLVVREASAAKKVLARIEPSSYEQIAGRIFLTGETSFSGRVERVGGATTTRCALRVSFQHRLLYCKVGSEDVARQLGERLYKEVVVTGQAQWLRNRWKVVDFTVNSVYQPQTGSIVEAFHALREAGGKGWDGIDDPKALLEEVSGK